MVNDLRAAMRGLRQNPAFTFVAVLTLALGIGATTTLFAIINAVLWRPLPYPDADRIVSVSEAQAGIDRHVVSRPKFREWQQSSRSFDALGAYHSSTSAFTGAGDPEQVFGAYGSEGFFATLGARPALGRSFAPAEYRAAGPPVMVLSDQFWRRAFGADRAALGRSVMLDGKSFTVIGVMPPDFAIPRGALFWLPDLIDARVPPGVILFTTVIGRLRPGVSVAEARAELTTITRQGDAQRPVYDRGLEPVVTSLHDRMYGDTRPALFLLFGAVGVLLLIACANVANLLLARATARQKEFSIRVALGASGWRLVRQLLCESVLLALSGGTVGLLIPAWTIGVIVRMSPQSVAHVQGIHVDIAVLTFAVFISVVTGVLFGLAPAIGALRGDGHGVLKEGSARTTSTVRHNRLRHALTVAELATALSLLTGAGLLTRSFARVMAIDPGFQPEHVLATTVFPPRSRYPDANATRGFFDRFAERVGALPGVESTALAGSVPLGGFQMALTFKRPDGSSSPEIGVTVVSPEYFRTLGIPVLSGRSFAAGDRRGAPAVAVINETMARAVFPGESALGHELPIKDMGNPRVIGVSHDVPQLGLDAVPKPQMYVSRDQSEEDASTLLVRAKGDPSPLESSVRAIVFGIDPLQPVFSMTTMEQTLSGSVAPRRLQFLLTGILAMLALTLAAIGLYGVMAYLVEQRTHEIGIRVALGAERRSVVWLVVRQGMVLAAIGIAIGIAGSLASVRLLRGMLYHVSIYDPWTFGGVAALLGVVALLASYVPARRATRVDPMVALRAE